MKRIVLISILFFGIIACTTDSKEEVTNDFIGSWKLLRMTGSMGNSVSTGTDMEWQESYLFNNDGTFIKSRDRNNTSIEISGTYRVTELSEGTFVELTYPTESEIIGSCISQLKETLFLKSKYQITGTWNQCDGPGLEYGKLLPVD